MLIQDYLAQNPHLEPCDVLDPENCAMVWDTQTQETVHVSIEPDGSIYREVI